MDRLLKVDGDLLTSADYWPKPINAKGLCPYGKELGEVKIFTREDIEELVQRAQKYKLELIESIDFSYKDKVLYWKRIGKRFTFIFFVFRKKDNLI